MQRQAPQAFVINRSEDKDFLFSFFFFIVISARNGFGKHDIDRDTKLTNIENRKAGDQRKATRIQYEEWAAM